MRKEKKPKRFKLARYEGYVIGFFWKKRPFLWDGLTARAIRKSKETR